MSYVERWVLAAKSIAESNELYAQEIRKNAQDLYASPPVTGPIIREFLSRLNGLLPPEHPSKPNCYYCAGADFRHFSLPFDTRTIAVPRCWTDANGISVAGGVSDLFSHVLEREIFVYIYRDNGLKWGLRLYPNRLLYGLHDNLSLLVAERYESIEEFQQAYSTLQQSEHKRGFLYLYHIPGTKFGYVGQTTNWSQRERAHCHGRYPSTEELNRKAADMGKVCSFMRWDCPASELLQREKLAIRNYLNDGWVLTNKAGGEWRNRAI